MRYEGAVLGYRGILITLDINTDELNSANITRQVYSIRNYRDFSCSTGVHLKGKGKVVPVLFLN
jgi:hypothetical protein